MKTFDSIGFIGGGRATRFLLEGWKAAGRMPATIRVADCNAAVLDALTSDFPNISCAAIAGAAGCGLVVLAVHPPVMKDAMAAVKPRLAPESTVLSLAPKFTAAAIATALGTSRIVRMIPNAPSAIGQGFNPVAYSAGVDADTKAALCALFAPWGEAPEVPEKDLEAYAILSAMGPTYFWFQWQALRELGTQFGLGAAETDRALLRMIQGSAGCLLASGLDPAPVMDMVPVKPLKDDEAAIAGAYRSKLSGLYEKIKP
jgi:pyrroline-5-carboxylate reductase